MILHGEKLSETYNVGPKDEVENKDVAARNLTMFGYNALMNRPFNDSDYYIDS